MQPEARRLLVALAATHDAVFPERIMPGQTAVGLGFDQRRAGRLFRELAALGYYEWDVSAYAGWLTAKGLAAAWDAKGGSS